MKFFYYFPSIILSVLIPTMWCVFAPHITNRIIDRCINFDSKSILLYYPSKDSLVISMGNHLSRMSVGFLHISCSVKILVSNLVFLIYFVAVVLYAWLLLFTLASRRLRVLSSTILSLFQSLKSRFFLTHFFIHNSICKITYFSKSNLAQL